MCRVIHAMRADDTMVRLSESFLVQILDKDGRRAKQIQELTFVPQIKSMASLWIRKLTASGNLRYVSSNLGTLEEEIQEGGTFAWRFRLNEPLHRGETFTHRVEMEANDSFLAPKESVSYSVLDLVGSVCIQIEFPMNRLPVTCEAWHLAGNKKLPVQTLHTLDGGHVVCLSIERPKVHSVYGVQWEW
jgi:hypothetical protein